MGLYNFKERFAPFILDGRKRHTIRATRKVRDKVGNIAHLYIGLRTKNATLLGRFPITKIEPIEILPDCPCNQEHCQKPVKVKIASEELSPDECEKLARLDGFESFAEMKAFWKGRLPFKGEIVHWKFD
jgi:ASCH domain-containing protein